MKIIGQVETNFYSISFKASLLRMLGCFLRVPLLCGKEQLINLFVTKYLN